MAFRSFVIPVRSPTAAEDELNAFLRIHRVLGVDRKFVDQGENSYWAVFVDYLEGAASRPGDTAPADGRYPPLAA